MMLGDSNCGAHSGPKINLLNLGKQFVHCLSDLSILFRFALIEGVDFTES